MSKRFFFSSRVALSFGIMIVGATLAPTSVRADLFSSTVYAVQPLESEKERTTSIAFSPDATAIAWATSGEEAGELLWGYDDNGLKWTKVFDVNPEGAFVAFSPDSQRIAVASPLVKPKKDVVGGATLQMLNTARDARVPRHIVQTPKSLWKIVLPKYSVSQTVFSPDNLLLAGICNDKTVRIWNTANGQPVKTFIIKNDVTALAFAKSGELLVACGTKLRGELQWWNLSTSKMVRKLDVGASFEALFIVDEGETIITSDAKGVATFWNAMTLAKKKIVAMQGSATKVFSLSPNEFWFAGFVQGESPTDLLLAIWEMETGILRISYPGNRGPERPVTFSSHTKHIASGGVGGTTPGVDHATLQIWPVNQ